MKKQPLSCSCRRLWSARPMLLMKNLMLTWLQHFLSPGQMLANFCAMNGEIQHEITSAIPSSCQTLKQTLHGKCCLTAKITVHILQWWVSMWRLLNWLSRGFGEHWYMQPIPRTDSSSHGEPHPGARSLDTWEALGLVLHYLNSTMLEITLQQHQEQFTLLCWDR